jgi:hypothetical protein
VKFLFVFLTAICSQQLALAGATKSLEIGGSSVAFFYGHKQPWDQLHAFDWVVMDPDHLEDFSVPDMPYTHLVAYVSVGEVHPSRPYASRIPQEWLRGRNRTWGSLLINQSEPDWPAFFSKQVIDPLWQRGFRTFFLDTLDSYHLFARTQKERLDQEVGMVALIRELVQRYPEIRFIYNRGFEILAQTHTHVAAVAAESLFHRHDAASGRYEAVSEPDHNWLLAQLQQVRHDFQLPVIAIDYVPLGQRELARDTARRIMSLGFTPWVTTAEVNVMGVGSIEVLPRRVLVVHSPTANESELRQVAAMRLLSLPLNHLGYVPEFVPTNKLPVGPLAGTYAGVVLWLEGSPQGRERQDLLVWLEKQLGDNLPVAFVNQIDFVLGSALGKRLGLSSGPSPRAMTSISVRQQAAMMGFEATPRPPLDGFYRLDLAQGQPLLTLQRGEVSQIAAALTSWGGYVLGPYGVVTQPGDVGDRWVIDPYAFLQQALKLPAMPVPDVTTETGRRMLMVHMDGDGFVSRSELPGEPLAGELVRDRVVRTYQLPMTISVIEAELSPKGLHPELSARAEQVARDIFSEAHVAIASHSYTHPFNWYQASNGAADARDNYHLPLPGYQFDLQREIEGSVRYIESRLAPAGKRVEMFFWTGDCNPGSDALARTQKLGLLNMNGGDTVATRTQASITHVEGLGMQRTGGFQVFAPNQNENVYTNNWRGPFYGYERVIETFEFTESPRRLKPINVYFHTYITTKIAGMQSLNKVMAYALKQETTPVFVSDYARKVLDFQRLVVARTPAGWRIRGSDRLRTLRLSPELGVPDLQRSQAIAGYRKGRAATYVHVSDNAAELVLHDDSKPTTVRLDSANASVARYTAAAGTYRWILEGTVPLKFTLDQVAGCRVHVDGKDLSPVLRQGTLNHYTISAHAARPLEAICQH